MVATLIDSYLTGREEFQMTCGYQPADILLYLLDGSFSCTVNGSEFVAKSGDLILFDKKTAMSRHVITPIRFLYIKFQMKREELFAIRTGIWRSVDGRVREDLYQIERLSSVRTQIGLQMREHYLNDLFLCLTDSPSNVSSQDEPIVDQSELFTPIAYMKAHLKKGLTLDELAHACGRSVSSLENQFREMYGVSIYRYFVSMRMDEAKRLLAKTSYTVTDIAMRCGYDNLFYFCNAFKKHMGMTPTEYRRMNLI